MRWIELIGVSEWNASCYCYYIFFESDYSWIDFVVNKWASTAILNVDVGWKKVKTVSENVLLYWSG